MHAKYQVVAADGVKLLYRISCGSKRLIALIRKNNIHREDLPPWQQYPVRRDDLYRSDTGPTVYLNEDDAVYDAYLQAAKYFAELGTPKHTNFARGNGETTRRNRACARSVGTVPPRADEPGTGGATMDLCFECGETVEFTADDRCPRCDEAAAALQAVLEAEGLVGQAPTPQEELEARWAAQEAAKAEAPKAEAPSRSPWASAWTVPGGDSCDPTRMDPDYGVRR